MKPAGVYGETIRLPHGKAGTMNTRVLWILSFACAFNVMSLSAAGRDEQQVLDERLQAALKDFDQAPDVARLASYANEVYGFTSKSEPQAVPVFKVRSLVQILAALERKTDPKFDPNDDPPVRNVSVPGGQYPSGVAPSAIKDEHVRKEYEAALAANRKKSEAFNLQAGLIPARERVLGMLEKLAVHAQVDHSLSLAQLTSLLDQHGIDAESRSRILGYGL